GGKGGERLRRVGREHADIARLEAPGRRRRERGAWSRNIRTACCLLPTACFSPSGSRVPHGPQQHGRGGGVGGVRAGWRAGGGRPPPPLAKKTPSPLPSPWGGNPPPPPHPLERV